MALSTCLPQSSNKIRLESRVGSQLKEQTYLWIRGWDPEAYPGPYGYPAYLAEVEPLVVGLAYEAWPKHERSSSEPLFDTEPTPDPPAVVTHRRREERESGEQPPERVRIEAEVHTDRLDEEVDRAGDTVQDAGVEDERPERSLRKLFFDRRQCVEQPERLPSSSVMSVSGKLNTRGIPIR